MKAKVGISVFFTYDDMEYEREIEDITVYKDYSWFGDLGYGGNVAFAIHGDLDENNQPIMQGLVIQVDSTKEEVIHEYIREGITYKQLPTLEEKKRLVIQKLDDFDLPYTDEEVNELIENFWYSECTNEANVNEIVLQHQYNIS